MDAYIGSYAGAVLGMPLSGIMTDYMGWESCFYFYGWCQFWKNVRVIIFC